MGDNGAPWSEDPQHDITKRQKLATQEALAPVEKRLKNMAVWVTGALAGITITIAVVVWFVGHFANAESLTGLHGEVKAIDAAQHQTAINQAQHKAEQDAAMGELKRRVRAQDKRSAWTVKLLWRMAPRSVRDDFQDPPPETPDDKEPGR